MSLIYKYPDEIRNYQFDYSQVQEIADNGEIIASVNSVVSLPTGLTIGAKTISADQKSVFVTISGGLAGVTYDVYCLVATNVSSSIIGCDGQLSVLNPAQP